MIYKSDDDKAPVIIIVPRAHFEDYQLMAGKYGVEVAVFLRYLFALVHAMHTNLPEDISSQLIGYLQDCVRENLKEG